MPLLALYTNAFPHGDLEARNVDPVEDLGFSQEYVRNVHEKHGKLPWVARPRDVDEDVSWRLQKRQAANDYCGGIGDALDGYYFIGRPGQPLFRITCRYGAVGGAPEPAGAGDPYLPHIMAAIDRCADPVFFNAAGGGCRGVQIANVNGRVKMFKAWSTTFSSTYAAASTFRAFATYIQDADCALNTQLTPLITACGPSTGGNWNYGPARTTNANLDRATIVWETVTQYGDRVPTSAAGGECAPPFATSSCPLPS